MTRSLASLVVALAGLSRLAEASPGPQPAAPSPAIAAPQDRPFPGTLRVDVDATDLRHKIFVVHETVPVQPGSLTLLYPQWETGSHAATSAVVRLAGLTIHARAARLAWRRDPVDVHAFHVDVPAGVTELALAFQYLSPPTARNGALEMSPAILDVPWHKLVLYPAGWFARDLPVAASLRVPAGFEICTSLEQASPGTAPVTFKPVALDELIDAPVYAGRHVRRVELVPGAIPIRLDLIGDTDASLAVTPAELDGLRAMVREAQRVFGPPPFRHYDFLVSVSDHLPSTGGIEHRASSESNVPAAFFQHPEDHIPGLDLLPHEFAHAWNGLYRQPAELWTPNFNVPMRDSLLWVYEGQTELWGHVLAARAGLRTVQDTLDILAIDAALVATRAGRAWKTLADSSHDPLVVIGQNVAWPDWQRREDYYPEGVMLWLDVDGKLRGRAKRLDDFARAFFAVRDGDLSTRTYTLDDLTQALAQLAADDWTSYLRDRLEAYDDPHVLDGLQRAGYRLVFTGSKTPAFRQVELESGVANLMYSIGLSIGDDGTVKAVGWDGPAFRAGLTVGARVTRVNGAPFAPAALEAAVARAAVRLTFSVDGETVDATIGYAGGLRYPRLERLPGTADGLGAVLRASRP